LDNTVAYLLDVDIMLESFGCIIENTGNSVNRWTVEGQIDDMIKGMDGNAGWATG
jgi:hypothetical protein